MSAQGSAFEVVASSRGARAQPAPPASETTPAVSPSTPQRLGRYLLVERLGAGEMAEVFRAIVTGPGRFRREVALKRLLPQRIQTRSFVELFAEEASLCARLSHPNIIQVNELDHQDGQSFMVMELVVGWDLGQIMERLRRRRRPVPARVAAEIVRQLAGGLAYLHGLSLNGEPAGIVHRNINPGNVMVSVSGVVKLLDLGLARSAQALLTGPASPGQLKGKLAYLAPEEHSGGACDHRVDIFASGVVLHEMLTGRPLFAAGSVEDTLRLTRAMSIPPPSRINRQVPPALDYITLKALARNRDDRYGSAAELAEVLESQLIRSGWNSLELAAFMTHLDAGERELAGSDPAEDPTSPGVPVMALGCPAPAPPQDQPQDQPPASSPARVEPAAAAGPLTPPLVPSERPRPARLETPPLAGRDTPRPALLLPAVPRELPAPGMTRPPESEARPLDRPRRGETGVTRTGRSPEAIGPPFWLIPEAASPAQPLDRPARPRITTTGISTIETGVSATRTGVSTVRRVSPPLRRPSLWKHSQYRGPLRKGLIGLALIAVALVAVVGRSSDRGLESAPAGPGPAAAPAGRPDQAGIPAPPPAVRIEPLVSSPSTGERTVIVVEDLDRPASAGRAQRTAQDRKTRRRLAEPPDSRRSLISKSRKVRHALPLDPFDE